MSRLFPRCAWRGERRCELFHVDAVKESNDEVNGRKLTANYVEGNRLRVESMNGSTFPSRDLAHMSANYDLSTEFCCFVLVPTTSASVAVRLFCGYADSLHRFDQITRLRRTSVNHERSTRRHISAVGNVRPYFT
jgi:hypothetical protein